MLGLWGLVSRQGWDIGGFFLILLSLPLSRVPSLLAFRPSQAMFFPALCNATVEMPTRLWA